MAPAHNVYSGKEPYIFISYSHRDAHLVVPLVEGLQARGFRVWYDTGIEAGTEWPEYIAQRLMDSGCVVAFLSRNAIDSHNCRREINFALELKKDFLVVYLEDVELTPGMRMQLNTLQAIFRSRTRDDEALLEALDKAVLLQDCRTKKEALDTVPPKTEPKPVEVKKIRPEPRSKVKDPVWERMARFCKTHKRAVITAAAATAAVVLAAVVCCAGILAPYQAVKAVNGPDSGVQQQIRSVTFLSSLEQKPLISFDVTENWQGTTYGWAEKSGGLYDVYIAAEGGVVAPADISGLFYQFSCLERVALEGLDTSNVTDMSYMFAWCWDLRELNVSGFDTSSVTNMRGMFSGTHLTELDLRGFDTSKVTDMCDMFWSCGDLERLDISSFETSAVTNMSGMFNGCGKLEILDLRDFDTGNVTNMSMMLYGTTENVLGVSALDVSGVTKSSGFMDNGRLVDGAPWEELFE